MASIQMRELIKNIIQDTSKDMREQADRVENAFAKRIEEIAGSIPRSALRLQIPEVAIMDPAPISIIQ
jgi:hypothetical protein